MQLRNSSALCGVAIDGTLDVHEEATNKIRRTLNFCAGYSFGSRAELLNATQAWCADPQAAEAEYGHISGWEVSSVSDMSYLFCSSLSYCSRNGCSTFNDDISRWDVHSVTNMNVMLAQRTCRPAAPPHRPMPPHAARTAYAPEPGGWARGRGAPAGE